MAQDRLSLFIFGYGYSSRFIAQQLINQGGLVATTVRRESLIQPLQENKITAWLWRDDSVQFANKKEIAQITESPKSPDRHLQKRLVDLLESHRNWLISVPPDSATSENFDAALALVKSVQEELSKPPEMIIYLSTTGVYGDRQGGWVDEDSALSPTTERGKRRVQCELAWQRMAQQFGAKFVTLRLAGIYGAVFNPPNPLHQSMAMTGRNALQSLRDGNAQCIVKNRQLFSRIFVSDISNAVQLILNQIERVQSFAYNLCDDEAAAPHLVIEYAATLLQIEPPPRRDFEAVKTTLSPMAASFYSESKQVSNQRLKSELGWLPQYPNYRDGLAAIFQSDFEFVLTPSNLKKAK